MRILEITTRKKRHLPLLLLADEQESMVDMYLDRGRVFVLEEDGVKAQAVVTDEGGGIYELKNLAVMPAHQGKGYGRMMVDWLFFHLPRLNALIVGTGESPATLGFYKRCGFRPFGRRKNFFIDHYNHPIVDGGVVLRDMILLRRDNTETAHNIEEKRRRTMAELGMVGLGHVAIYVKDVARSKAFYSDVLGIEELWYVKHENTGSQLQFMQQKGVILELVQKGSGQKQRDGVDGTINHLCMQVQDIEAAKAALEVAGVVFENEIQLDPDLYPNGEKSARFRGPDGEMLQIEQIL